MHTDNIEVVGDELGDWYKPKFYHRARNDYLFNQWPGHIYPMALRWRRA